jgi:uracil phosphoribosyltransferase
MGTAVGSYARYWYVETGYTRIVAGLWHFTGGSALMAVDVLLSRGVPEERILFLNLIASPEGAAVFAKRFPKLRVVTAFVDEGLDEKK